MFRRRGAASSASSTVASSHWVDHWRGQSNLTDANGGNHAAHKNPRAVWAGRVVFLAILSIVATVLGIATHYVLFEAEKNLAKTQFESISSRAIVEAQAAVHRRRWAGVSMANTVAALYPNATKWPFVEFLEFERLAGNIKDASGTADMGFVPFLFAPDSWPQFEDFAYDVYQNKLGWPNTTGTSPGFRGIWGQRVNEDGTKTRYHDTTADTVYDSPYKVMAPIFRTDEGAHPVLMFNVHSGKFQGQALDRMISCSLERKQAYENGNTEVADGESSCGVITELFQIVKKNERWGAALFRPIYPVNDSLTVRTSERRNLVMP